MKDEKVVLKGEKILEIGWGRILEGKKEKMLN